MIPRFGRFGGRTGRIVAAAVAVVVIVAGGALWAFGAIGSRGAEIEWTRVAVDDIVTRVELSGTLASEDSSLLGPPKVAGMWDFKISFLAPEGGDVPEGAPVLGFDTSELDRRLEDRRTEAEEAGKEIEKLTTDLRGKALEEELAIAEAKAELRKSRLKVDRPAELKAAAELAKARIDLEIAENQVDYLERKRESAERSGEAQLRVLTARRDRARREVAEIEAAIERMTVKAPRSGTVIYVSDWNDQKKKVGDSAWMHDHVVELPNLERMMGKGEVDEADAGRLREGQTFRITLDAHPDIEFAGRVQAIGRTVQRKSWRSPLKVVKLDLGLDDTDRTRMRPGMRFVGKIETGRIEGVTVVPVDAVFGREDGPVAYRRTGSGFEEVSVRLGERDERNVEVLEGLEPGDRVALADPTEERG